MAKIMLVEDDNNLREIYEARLTAEGYEIISAQDGEEALALAVKERPDLIISDVMMPKISGFDMLDILRTTPETRDTKVIMMTALSQAEDKARADKLGADRYLVKSQVTLEDVARAANEILNGTVTTPVDTSSVANLPAEPQSVGGISSGATAVTPLAPADDTASPAQANGSDDTGTPGGATSIAAPVADQLSAAIATVVDQGSTSSLPSAQSTSDEQQTVQNQITDFVQHAPAAVPQTDPPSQDPQPASGFLPNQEPPIQDLRPQPAELTSPETAAAQPQDLQPAAAPISQEVPAKPAPGVDPNSIAL